MIITSAANDRIKELKKLLSSSKARREKRVYVVEGIRMFREIPPQAMYQVVVSESGYGRYKQEIECGDVIITTDSIFAALSDTVTPQGILALVKQKDYFYEDIISCDDNIQAPFLFVLEHIQDPGNMGTILRTAEAAGATGLMLGNNCVDVYNPKVIRSTMGSIFRLPVYVSGDLKSDIERLKSDGVCVFGTHLSGREFYDKDYKGAVAFLVGNEGNGLSDEISSTADELIRIPMKGKVESLNAATSVAVVGYEVARQRR